MSVNKYTTVVTSEILKNKLAKIIEALQAKTSPSSTVTELVTYEQLLSEATKAISTFYKDLSAPKFNANTILADTEPNLEDRNTNFQNIFDDLDVLFSEFENIESVALGNFNYMVSRLNRINSKTKLVSSKISDYVLFSENKTKDAIFFSDSFNNLTKIENNSPLLNEEQCDINQSEGIATLPIDRVKQKPITIKNLPVINSNSNGTAGNSSETTRAFNGDISVITDNNADTWFEYERIPSTGNDGIPLVLDITINFGNEQIINSIRVNPNNFGTKTQVEIDKIDTSVDGKTFVSIKDDIPIADWIPEDEENTFSLAPTSSKFAGQGVFTFTPRKAKYVRLSMRQNTAYPIDNGKMRYAIGIRDVTIEALPFKTKGEIVSSTFTSLDEVKKVALLVNQNPDPSTLSKLAKIQHYVSVDNGISWNEIRPLKSTGITDVSQEVPEILNFNDVAAGSISTSDPVTSLRYKAKLERNTDAFIDNNGELAQVTSTTTELHFPPSSTPFVIQLQNLPIEGTISIVDPNFGSRGLSQYRYDLATGTGKKIEMKLPYDHLPIDYQKNSSGKIIRRYAIDLFVDDKQWIQGAPTGTDEKFQVIYTPELKIKTGDGSVGACPQNGQLVSINFSKERLFPTEDEKHICQFEFPVVPNKSLVKIYRYGNRSVKYVVIPKNATAVKLEGDGITHANDASIWLDGIPYTILTPAQFINGSSEFNISSNQISIDTFNGYLYLSRSIADAGGTKDVSFGYSSTSKTELSSDDWDFVIDDSGRTTGISIKDDQYETITKTQTITGNNNYSFSLYYFHQYLNAYDNIPGSIVPFNAASYDGFAIKKGSVVISNPSGVFDKEVAFINGADEFEEAIKVTEVIDGTNLNGAGIKYFEIDLHIINSDTYTVQFSNNDIFGLDQEQDSPLDGSSNVGDWYVEKNTGSTKDKIYVKLAAAVTDPGNIYYYFTNPKTSNLGLYSIDYRQGIVYTNRPITSTHTATYENTIFYASYPIGRLIDQENYILNTASKTLVVKDTEILNNQRTRQVTTVLDKTKFYQVSYKYVVDNRKDVIELEPFFTPILKNYALKIITKSKMI